MSKEYKLTTDLKADCMALIPKYITELNQNKIDLIFIVQTGKVYMCHKKVKLKNEIQESGDDFMFKIISHCLRTIPEFQAETKQYREYLLDCQDYDEDSIIREYPPARSIASATLHGQGEYPPSTLEELCKSYKNVMSK